MIVGNDRRWTVAIAFNMIYCLVVFAAACGAAECIPKRGPERHQVIVVGAGVAGFTAAATLLEHNVTSVLVLEAADYIGGRTHTVQFGGVNIDLGAEFVHGETNNSVYELVNRYDLLVSYETELLQPDMFLFANTSGHFFNSSYLYTLLDDSSKIMYEDGVRHCNGSMADYFYPRLDEYLTSKNVDPQLREAIRHLVPQLELTNTLGDDLSLLGAWGFADVAPIVGDYTLKWKPGTAGYKTLFDILSKKYPNASEALPVADKILLGKQVTRVERREGEVEVTCADGSTYLADHVIVTVSLGVLKKHAATMFYPALPPEKTTAIETLGFGCLGKVILLFPTRWWPKDINIIIPLFTQQGLADFRANSIHGSWTSNITGFTPMLYSNRMLRVWFAGPACRQIDTFSDDKIVDGLMELLNRLVGHRFNITRPESILRSKWASNPYTLGSYSFRTVESDRLNITNNDLASPIFHEDKPVILFAGEATNHYFSSLVNGAMDTGRREARNILNYIDKHRS